LKNYLIGHVSAARVGTYAYVNPLVAILVGCSLGDEELTGAIGGGMVIILAGVALVRGAGVYRIQPMAQDSVPDKIMSGAES